ncbi:glycosyltransferase family 4 protein [Naasia sp. SYSU D00948]|uniref:glycosyltransferase family 4 protein n=1 Tax=Naasia sp. SYSU D00948 TaxID=2817379 RepID=UPI001B30689A|nr:glycosyltransferase family 4 protein [Naasia sp. SYSU D00948]
MTGVRPVVHHLGRAGDIAGGMTQVLNGYLEWPFPRVDVAVITSRGDPHDIRAGVRRAASAAGRVLQLPRSGTVVVAHLSERGSFLREGSLLRAAAARGVATVAHLHGSSFASFAEARPRLVRWALSAADRVVSLSEESSRVAARFVPADRISLIPNAIPSGAPATKERLVVFGGVVTHRKGIDVLQAAWDAARQPGWELVVAGPPVDGHLIRPDLRQARFLGAVSHAELMALLDRSAIAVLPSREEAMPMFILEAMARRNCVIATRVGGIAAVLGGGEGIVLPPGEVEPLAAALGNVMTDGAARGRYADAAASAFADRFSAETVFPMLEELWLTALEDANTRRAVPRRSQVALD